jgi:putative exosortase-associated protein (TIGR04073 family)
MRNALSLFGLLAIIAVVTPGCSGPEEKLGRGVRNTADIVRMGELRTSVEQTGVWDGPADACTTGVVKGVDKTLARTGLGIYEVITFPIPPYHPIWTKYLSPEPSQPDNYVSSLPSGPLYATDHYTGFSGGSAFGWVPGSQFNVFGD